MSTGCRGDFDHTTLIDKIHIHNANLCLCNFTVIGITVDTLINEKQIRGGEIFENETKIKQRESCFEPVYLLWAIAVSFCDIDFYLRF
jgi:hypothetical protein